MEFSVKLKVQTYLSAVVLQFAHLAACYSCTHHMHCIRKCHEQKLKCYTVTQLHANTQCHSKERVSLITRYALNLLPFTLPGFALMLLRSDLPQDLQRKKVCVRERSPVWRSAGGGRDWKLKAADVQYAPTEKKNKHKSRPWKTVAHFICPRASKHQCQFSSIHLLHHSSVPLVAKQKLKGTIDVHCLICDKDFGIWGFGFLWIRQDVVNRVWNGIRDAAVSVKR